MIRANVALARNISIAMAASKKVHAVLGIILNDEGQLFMSLRPPHVDMPGWWEFPGGKVEAGEETFDALRRELFEELGINVTEAAFSKQYTHDYDHCSVLLDVWHVLDYEGEPSGCEGQAVRWVPLDDVADYKLLDGCMPILEDLSALLN